MAVKNSSDDFDECHSISDAGSLTFEEMRRKKSVSEFEEMEHSGIYKCLT